MGIVGETLPAPSSQLGPELGQLPPPGRKQVTAARLTEEVQSAVADHAPVHDPNALGLAELGLDLSHDGLDRLHVTRVAGKGAVRQRKTVPADNQGHDDLLAVAAVIAGISPLSQVVFGC